MRWCRRGHLLMLGAIILVLLVIELLRGAAYTSDRPPVEEYNTNASEFLTKKHALTLKPQKVILACDGNNIEVLLIVPSAVSHQDARAAIRTSWSPLLPSSWALVFFLGATKDSSQQDQVKAEASKFEDIIQDSRFLDSYYNLTFKTLALLQWTNTFCANTKFVLKIDDDMYLNIPKLRHLTTCITEARDNMYNERRPLEKNLNNKDPNKYNVSNVCSRLKPYELIHYYINADSHEYESYFFGGYLYNGVKADRSKNSKWFLDSKLYSAAVLPPFLSGTAYMLSTNLAQHLLYASKHEPIIHLEDVYITGLVGSLGLKLRLSHLEGWSRFRPQWNSVCLFQDLLTVHGLSPTELLTMTSSVDNLDHEECNTVSVHISNFLNSLISSIFPRIT